MTQTRFALAALMALVLALTPACGGKDNDPSDGSGDPSSTSKPSTSGGKSETPERNPAEPERIELEVLVVACQGGRLGFDPKPDVATAKKVAKLRLLEARGADDFGAIVRQHSADPDAKESGGIMKLVNFGQEPSREASELARTRHPAISKQGFQLKVGEFALVPFDAESNPVGHAIIRRTR